MENHQDFLLPQEIVVNDYFGKKIKDPYRYMENSKDSTVLNWYSYNKKNVENLFENSPERKSLLKQINSLKSNTDNVKGLQITPNNLYFYLKVDSEDGVKKLFLRNGLSGREKLLFDPKNYATKSDIPYNINYIKPNWDGSKVVISFTKNDEEISEISVLDVSKKKLLDIRLKNCWPTSLGGISWIPDNTGFIYQYIPTIDKTSEEYILNTASVLYKLEERSEKTDILISKNKNPKIPIESHDFPISEILHPNDEFLFAGIKGVSTYSDYYYSSLNEIEKNEPKWELLFKKSDKVKNFKTSENKLIFLTSFNAPNFQICQTSLTNPDFETPTILVNEDPSNVITEFALTKSGLFYVKNYNGVEAKLYLLRGDNSIEIPIPKSSGTINLISNGPSSNDLWIQIEGWTFNKQIFKYNLEKNTFIDAKLSSEELHPALKDAVIKEVEVTSHDGTKVPLSIIHKKNIKLNSKNRVLLSGYGAYGISDRPKLERYLPHWLEESGVYAIAHVRGGGEKGNKWHMGGFRKTKPNSWKDFISCAEYLIEKGFTIPSRTAIFSGSAGGIVIGRALTERPDLFAAAMIRVGVLNTLRTETGPNGLNNTKEFGTVKDSTEFEALLEMDSYHHIEKGKKYPAMYLIAGLKDARVNAWETGKFAAKMKSLNGSDNPVLLSIDFDGGHGLDAEETKKNEELANMLTFALWQTGHPEYQIK